MKRILTIIFCAICMVRPELYAQIPPSAENDTVSNRQDPNAPDPFDPDPYIPTIVGDALDRPFIVGIQSQDFSYTDTRNTNNFYDLYNGLTTKDVFYTFTLTVPMNVTMTHQGSSVADTYMYLLASDGTLITSNDDYDGDDHCTNIQQSFIRRQLAAGTYYVVSEGYSSDGFIATNISGNVSSSFNYPVFPSTYSSDPNTAVGGMSGQFGVSPLGGATYSIPIEVPQGVGGLQPQLSIVYNSQSSNGLCGYGTSLAGISSITRGPKDIYHDSTSLGINYLADDALYLDGVRLILSSGTAGQEGAEYNPESDPFTRVITHGACTSTSNNIWFEVRGSDGMIYWYGKNQDSRLSYTVGGSHRIHSWYMCHAQQPTGNYITWYYQQTDYCVYPFMITYGSNIDHTSMLANIIEFTYENRKDSVPIRFDGKQGRMGKRLKTITSSTNYNTYRSYHLNYDTISDGTAYKFSRLTSVTEKNGQDEALPATKFVWSFLPAVNYSSNNLPVNTATNLPSNITTDESNHIYEAGDLNGDGISDIINIMPVEEQKGNSTVSYTIVMVFYSSISPTGQISFSTTEDYYNLGFLGSFACTTLSMKGRMIVDIDGDGINECLIPVYKETDGAMSSRLCYNIIGQNYDYCNHHIICTADINPLFSSSDLDNDGKTEVVYLETIQTNGKYCLQVLKNVNSSSVLQQYAQFNLSLSYEPKTILFEDWNGNGLQDLLVLTDNNYTVFWNQGNGLSSGTFSDSNKLTGTNLAYHDAMTCGDFNGDGLLDILTKESTTTWYFYINTGHGNFAKTTAYNSSIQFPFLYLGSTSIRVLDFDGDGLSDVVITEPLYCYNTEWIMPYFTQSDTYWMRSTGTSLELVYYASSSRDTDALDTRFLTGDFDGDGRMELVNYGYDCVNGNHSNTDPVWRIYKNSNLTAQTGRVTSITGDFGARTDITYATLTDSSVYNRGSAEPYPAPRYTIPFNVVKQTVQNNGAAGNLTTQYSYEGLKIHLKGRGLLGFSKTSASCTTTGLITESGITQWDTAHYIPKVTYSKTTIGSSNAQTVSTLAIVDKGQKKYFAYPSQTLSTDMDDNTVTTVYSYDTINGWLLSETVTYGTNMYRSTAYADYVQAGGSYRPQTVTVSQRHPDDTSPFSVTTAYTYNSTTGTVASRVDNYGTTKPLTTQYTYDLWGNLTSQVSTGSGITTPCTTLYSYESTHRFPVRIYTSPSSTVMKYTYDLWGNVLSEQDSINSSISNTVTNTYNNWGQLESTTQPDGSLTTYTYGWSSDPGQRYYTIIQGTAMPWVKTWYDNQGREVTVQSVGPHDVIQRSSTAYDSKGQVTSRTEQDGNLTLTRSYTYDARGRLSSESSTGGRTVTYSYGNRTVTVTENNDRNTVKTYDAWGNLKTLSNYTSYLTNTYSSNGGIRQTVSGGPVWTFTYDDRGNRISMTDPDAGTITYVYDALGRETSRTDGRGVVFVTEYDYLGRVMQRSAGSEVTSYTYGASGYGQSRLISESNGSWTKSYEYDNLGRVTSETMSDGTHISKSKAYTYGSNGLLSSRLLPGGKGYSYTYDTYGNLVGVDFDSGTIEWNLTGYTGKRTVSTTVLDGSTSHPFIREIILDGNGLLDSITTCQDNCYYQADDYGFSAQTGNLTYRKNNSSYYPQTYGYDQADRLVSVHQNNQTIQSMTYSYTGNITSKTGIGSYDYNTARPHAVASVDNTAGLIDTDEQYITYDSWGKVSAVLHSDGTDSYSYSIGYGPDQQRITSSLSKNNSLQYETFYWDDYEEKKVGNVLYRYYYVYGANGLEGLHVVKTSPNNQTTTHTTKVLTDHLGSIMSLIDNYDWAYDATFDAWGKRDLSMPYWFEPGFNRGFTGHEHLDEMGLINMNGRMYDSDLGRFLSPDNYIQSPYNHQNYNRYSYCLNNPLKYTDPSGDVFWEAVLIGGAIFGSGNLIAHSIRGDVNDFGDGLRYFGQGFLAGAALGATWYLAPSIPIVGNAIQGYMTWSFQCKCQMAAVSAISGIVRGICTGNWNTLSNTMPLFLGNFYIDEKAGFFEGIWQGYSKQSWESLQTGFGHTVNQFFNTIWQVESIQYGNGATVAESKHDGFGGFTIGSYVFGDKGIKASPYDELFQHEYGHYLQSRRYGPGDVFVEIWSFFSYAWAKDHRETRVEIDANRKAFKYFVNNFNGFGKVNEDGYWSSDNWKWDVNPLEKEKNEWGLYPTSYKF